MSIELVKKYEGKIEIYPKILVRSYTDFPWFCFVD